MSGFVSACRAVGGCRFLCPFCQRSSNSGFILNFFVLGMTISDRPVHIQYGNPQAIVSQVCIPDVSAFLLLNFFSFSLSRQRDRLVSRRPRLIPKSVELPFTPSMKCETQCVTISSSWLSSFPRQGTQRFTVPSNSEFLCHLASTHSSFAGYTALVTAWLVSLLNA